MNGVQQYEYVTHPNSGKVHLRRVGNHRALCRLAPAAWTLGDETTSGLAATCDTCKRKAFGR